MDTASENDQPHAGPMPAPASADDATPDSGAGFDDGSGNSSDNRFGLPTASALVVGSVIGTGVFALPSALAGYGPISLVALALVTVGALALAATFQKLSRRNPGSGGPYLYARDAFGDFAGFINAWSYWITAWAGNAAIAVAWVGYVEVFWNSGHRKGWTIAIALAGLWIPAAVNLTGIRQIGAVENITTVLKFIPLLFIATVGLFFVKSANFGAFNATHGSALSAISAAGAIALFSYIGIETTSVTAGRVRDPKRNVGRAAVIGTTVCAVVYLLGTFAVFGTVAHDRLLTSTAPFTDSADAMFGGRWAGDTIAVAAIISGIGSLVGWTLVVGEMPRAAAHDRLFPSRFGTDSPGGVPAFGILGGTLLASVLTVVSYTSFTQVFTTVVLLSVLTAVIPYLFSAAAQLYWLASEGRRVHAGHLVRDAAVATTALLFSFWSLAGSGYQAAYYGLFCLLLGLPVYVWLKAERPEGASR